MHDWWPEGTVADVIESSEAMSDANGDAETGLPPNNIWFRLVDGNAATSCSTEEKEEKKEPSIEEEKKEDKVATEDPYMTTSSMPIPSTTIKKRKKKKRGLTKKGKEKKSEKEKEKKAERSTVKMYYWNVALSEHCEDVPLECGSVHWNTEEVCEVAPFTQCHKIDTSVTAAKQSRATGSRGVISEGQDRLETTG